MSFFKLLHRNGDDFSDEPYRTGNVIFVYLLCPYKKANGIECSLKSFSFEIQYAFMVTLTFENYTVV